MVEDSDDSFEDVEAFPYNQWCVQQLVSVDEDGVSNSVAVFLSCEFHEMKTVAILHPRMALKLAADMIMIAANE